MIKYKLIATIGISSVFAINAFSDISIDYRNSEFFGRPVTIKQSSVKSSSFDESKAPFIPPGWRYPRYDAIGHSCLKVGSTVRTGNEMKLVRTIADVSSVLTGDVDGDGELEIVTVGGLANNFWGDTLKIYSKDGSLKRSVSLPLSNCRVTMLEDVDNDGAMEIFIGSGNAWQISAYIYKGNGTLLKEFRNQHIGGYIDMQIHPIAFSKGKVIVLYNSGWARVPRGLGAFDYATGAELWYYQIGPVTWSSSIDDMDGDGLLDITSSTGTVHNGANGNGTTDGDCYVIVVNENGSGKLTKIYESPSDGDAEGLFADINGDGKSEIIGFKGFNKTYYPGQSRIQIFDRSGNVLKTFYGPQNRTFKGKSEIMGSYAVGDLDGNGALEIVTTAISDDTTPNVTTTYVLDTNLNKIAESNIDGEVRFIGDVNGDGNMEVVMISQSGVLRILNRNLNQLSEIKVGDESGEVIASDLNGDGRIELLCRSDQLYILGLSDPVYKLQVSSTNPTNGVVITSSTGHGGTTEYSLDISQNSTVNLQAPLYIGSLNNRKRFSNWSGSITSSNLSVNFLLNGDKVVTANYVDDPETKILRIVGDLTFDSVPVSGNSVKTITVWNDGNSVLTVTSIDCPQGFSATPQSFILSPGSSQPVEVTFAPTSSGTYLGLFVINSDKTSGNNTLVCFGQVGCSYSLSTQNWSAPAAGGSVNITVNCANCCSWNVSNQSSEWITVNPLNGNGSGVITITVAQNSTGSQRDCVLTIAGQSFQINQSAAENLVVATQGGSRYSIPGTNTIYCSFAYPAGRQIYSLIWRPILPPHFMLLDAQGDGVPVVFNNEIVFINFTGSNPITFSYRVAISEQSSPTNQLQAEVEYMLNGMINSETIYASPNPLIIREISLNSADYRSNFWVIDSAELTRVLSYWRMQGYCINSLGADGYAVGSGDRNGVVHSADYRVPFWRIDGTEVNRVLAYWRAGGYHIDPRGLDGYAPGFESEQSKTNSQPQPIVCQETMPTYLCGSLLCITNTFEYSGKLLSLLWRPKLPQGWSIQSVSGDGNPELVAGEVVCTGILPLNSVRLIYTVSVPSGDRTPKQIGGEIEYQLSGMVNPAVINCDPLNLATVKIVAAGKQGNMVNFNLLGESNGLYRIEYSTDLKNWNSLFNIRAVNGKVNFTDSPSSQRKFYRAVLLE